VTSVIYDNLLDKINIIGTIEKIHVHVYVYVI